MSRLENIKAKILAEKSLTQKIIFWKAMNQKMVFTNGCFDILHPGHIQTLAQAAELGDVLIVGLNSDHSVKQLKGEHRPIMNESSRALLLASLQVVSAVVIFNETTPQKLIETITPDVLVKGGDYEIKDIVGADWVQQHGGLVQTIPLLEGFSTTNIENILIKKE
jgi:D-glycero-beta-D-manno-heptose 1-phosphate adenylyltransferase